MQEITGNIWDQPATIICITTNEIINKKGALVMGRGIAFQCVDRNPGIQFSFGELVKNNGSIFQVTQYLDIMSGRLLALFPVKQHWRQFAKLPIIEQSAIALGNFAYHQRDAIFVLPRPGCSNGGLEWGDVKPRIEQLLPDNVHIVHEGGHD